MEKKQKPLLKAVGTSLILLGVLTNHWLVGFLLAPDGVVSSLGVKSIIWLLQLSLITAGFFVLLRSGITINVILKVAVWNLLMCLMLVIGFELAFGGWLGHNLKANMRRMTIPFSVQHTFDVGNLYPRDSLVVYTRDRYGLRGNYPGLTKVGVVTVGSSTTNNRTINDGHTWQDVLQKAMLENGDTFYVANAGVSGATYYEYVEYMQYWLPLVPSLKPTYTIFLLGGLDLFLSPDIGDQFVDTTLSRLDRVKRNSVLWFVVSQLFAKDAGAKSVFKEPPAHRLSDSLWTDKAMLDSILYDSLMQRSMAQLSKHILRLIQLTDKWGTSPVFLSQPFPLWQMRSGKVWGYADTSLAWVRYYNGVEINGVDHYHLMRRQYSLISDLTREKQGHFIDIMADSSWQPSDWYDSAHFTPQGCEKFGRLLYKHLAPLITGGRTNRTKDD